MKRNEPARRFLSFSLLAFVVAALAAAQEAGASTTVPGSANPNLANRAPAYSCCNGDTVPAQSATKVNGVEFAECDILRFTVSGRVSFTDTPPPPGDNPDGDDAFSMTNYGDGISAPQSVRANALVGVFLEDSSPTGTATPPTLNFADGLDFSILFPEVGQIFFIGDGLTSDSKLGQTNGLEQDFQVPQDATELWLGTADGEGWLNNTGSFDVDVTVQPSRCGDATLPPGISAGDALVALRTAVGADGCLDCECDVDRSGKITAGDALAILRRAVGQNVTLHCDCCSVS